MPDGFIGRSVVKVFANGRQAIARRVYPIRADSLGAHLFTEGTNTRIDLQAWEMQSANAY